MRRVPHSAVEAMERLAADPNVASTIAAAQHDERAVNLAVHVSAEMKRHVINGGSASSAFILICASVGFMQGAAVDALHPDASRVTESLTEVLAKVLRFAAEEGFASTMKELKNARDGNTGTPANE